MNVLKSFLTSKTYLFIFLLCIHLVTVQFLKFLIYPHKKKRALLVRDTCRFKDIADIQFTIRLFYDFMIIRLFIIIHSNLSKYTK